MKVKISDIGVPKEYIRKRKGSHVSYLLDVVKASSQWPFDGIEVASNGVKKITKTKDSKGKTVTVKPWELLDGIHRLAVAQKLKMKEIPVEVKAIKDPALRFLEQYLSNSAHGLKLDPNERSQAVWIMVNKFKMKTTLIAQKTGLSQSSVSRIASRKQGWIGYKPESMTRPQPSSKENGGDNGEPENGNVFTPIQFIDRLSIMLEDFQRQRENIAKAMKQKFGDKTKSFLNELNQMVLDLTKGT